jgi:putative endonuclease
LPATNSATNPQKHNNNPVGISAELEVLQLLLGNGWQALEHRWHCRWGEIDLLVAKPERLLLVEVKARSRVGPDGWGAGAFGILKRKKLERSFSCWLALHQSWHQASVEIVLALVPIVSLPSQRLQKPIRWLIWHG